MQFVYFLGGWSSVVNLDTKKQDDKSKYLADVKKVTDDNEQLYFHRDKTLSSTGKLQKLNQINNRINPAQLISSPNKLVNKSDFNLSHNLFTYNNNSKK